MHGLRKRFGSGVMFIAPDGTSLFMRRTDTGLWSLPAGHGEPGEDPAEAAMASVPTIELPPGRSSMDHALMQLAAQLRCEDARATMSKLLPPRNETITRMRCSGHSALAVLTMAAINIDATAKGSTRINLRDFRFENTRPTGIRKELTGTHT